jgi:hypothetical protein
MMRATYCRQWNSVLNEPMDPVTEEQARQLDASGDSYTVVLSEDSTPRKYIEVNWRTGGLGVFFLDEQRRPHLAYSFRRVDDERMFLDDVLRWEYPDDEAIAMSGAKLIDDVRYQQDGRVLREVRDDVAQEIRRQEFTDVPLEVNWEPVPTFGDWEQLARRDRSVGAPR